MNNSCRITRGIFWYIAFYLGSYCRSGDSDPEFFDVLYP